MNKAEKKILLKQIKELENRKETLLYEFIGACNEINVEIKLLKKKIKEG